MLVVFSLLTCSANLFGEERRGAELKIQKLDGQRVKGELIAVKQNSLLLMASESGTDVSVDFIGISKVTIVKKSMAPKAMAFGFLIGAGFGFINGFARGDEPKWLGLEMSRHGKAIVGGIFFGLIGLLIGATGGAARGIDKTFQIEGKDEQAISVILEKLRSEARFPNYQ